MEQLSKAQEKRIRALHTKKGRQKYQQCLVEGKKVIETAGNAIEFMFTAESSEHFDSLVTTDTPQDIAAVATIPQYTMEDILAQQTIIVVDGVQDPGNIGSILRLCLGFNASLLLVNSVDVTNPKVVRSSVGAVFQIPWMHISQDDISTIISDACRPVYLLEKRDYSSALQDITFEEQVIIVAGSEGSGIHSPVTGTSVYIEHDMALESLNVAHSLAITLYTRYSQ